jgi:hypothetical protein
MGRNVVPRERVSYELFCQERSTIYSAVFRSVADRHDAKHEERHHSLVVGRPSG